MACKSHYSGILHRRVSQSTGSDAAIQAVATGRNGKNFVPSGATCIC